MGKIFPTEIKDLFEMCPAGVLLFEVVDAAEAWVGKQGEEVYGIEILHRAIEPASVAGVEHKEAFFIGVNENAKAVRDGKLQADPEANNPETLKARSGGLKRYLSKYGINLEGADIEQCLNEIKGKHIIGKIVHQGAIKDGKPMLRDDGSQLMNARAERWFSPGEVEPALAPEAAAAASPTASRTTAPTAGPRPAAAQAAPAPQQAAPTAPPTRPAMRRLGK